MVKYFFIVFLFQLSTWAAPISTDSILERYNEVKKQSSWTYNGLQVGILTRVTYEFSMSADEAMQLYKTVDLKQAPKADEITNAELVRAVLIAKTQNQSMQDVLDIYQQIHDQQEIWSSGQQIAILTSTALQTNLSAEQVFATYKTIYDFKSGWSSGAQVAELTRTFLSQQELSAEQVFAVYNETREQFNYWTSGHLVALITNIAVQNNISTKKAVLVYKSMKSTSRFWSSKEGVAEMAQLISMTPTCGMWNHC